MKNTDNIVRVHEDSILFRKVIMAAVLVLSAVALNAQTTRGPQPTICNRACWTASASSGCSSLGSLSRAIIHHTAAASEWNTTSLENSKSIMRGKQSYDKNTKGFCDIGYHFLVDKLGNIFEGRYNSLSNDTTAWRRGSHAGCGNTATMGFSFMGYFHTPYNHNPPTIMRTKMYDLIAWRMPNGWNPYGNRTTYSGSLNGTAAPIDTHAWVGASGCSGTACPGSVIINNYITSDFFGGEMRNGVAARRTPSVNNAAVVSMSYPSSVAAGSSFSATVTMRNTGGTHWVDTNNYKLGSQNPGNNTRWGLNRVTFSGTISPNVNHAFNFNCTAPTTAANYPFDWRMVEETVQWFGATAVGSISVTAGCTQTITRDNHQSGFTASSNWSTGTSAPDKLGTNYRFRSTAAVSDPAKWTVTLNCSGTHTVQAWWSQGSNRSKTAAYHIDRVGGTSTITVNQQANGGKWNTLGTFNIAAGSRSVQLSCWTTTGFVVMADGVRWIKN